MNLNDLVTSVAEKLRSIPLFVDTPVIEADIGDVVSSLERAIAKTNRAIEVVWRGFKPDAQHDDEGPYGTSTIIVGVYEKPSVNRRREGAPTLMNMAQEVAKEISHFNGLQLRQISQVSELGNGAITLDVEFEVTASL